MTSPSFSVQLDIETFSQKKTAAIASIGACKFNDKQILDTFSINIDPKSCKEAGLHFQQETIDWWKTQKPEAFKALKNNRVSLKEALISFSDWYGVKSTETWACGPDFDCVILENAYIVLDIPCPWWFYDNRCFRTFKSMFKSDIPFENVKHDALSDAIYQTKYMLDVLNRGK